MNDLQEALDQIQALQDQLIDLSLTLKNQSHNGMDGSRINLFDIFGVIQTVSVIPAGVPVVNSLVDQVKIYVSGSTYTLYIYDTGNGVWHHVTLT